MLAGLAREGMTMLMATHDLRLARRVADAVVFLDGGTLVEQGPPAELFARPADPRTRRFVQTLTLALGVRTVLCMMSACKRITSIVHEMNLLHTSTYIYMVRNVSSSAMNGYYQTQMVYAIWFSRSYTVVQTVWTTAETFMSAISSKC